MLLSLSPQNLGSGEPNGDIMDSYLTLFSSSRSPCETLPSSPENAHKLSARGRRKQSSSTNGKDSASSQTPRQRQSGSDAFRSVAVLEEVVRLENGASRTEMTAEEAFRLLRGILPPNTVQVNGLSSAEVLDGIDAACWRMLAPGDASLEDVSGRPSLPFTKSPPPRNPRRQCYKSSVSSKTSSFDFPISPRRTDAHQRQAMNESSESLKLRFSELYRGVEGNIREREAACESLKVKLQQTVQRNNGLPVTIKEREAAIHSTQQAFMTGAAQALDCDAAQASSAEEMDSMAASVEAKMQTLRRRRDLRVWACKELRTVINDHMTRASELKKEISALVAEVKKEELAHKVKAKRVEGIIASVSEKKHPGAGNDAGAKFSPAAMVARGNEKKARLLDEIERRKVYLRMRTEEIFNTRNDVRVLEQKKADAVEKLAVLEQEISHIQRSCTPRPDWAELLNATLVTTAIDRAGKKAKLRMESSRRKYLDKSGAQQEHEDPGDTAGKQLKQILTSNWSTIEKVNSMSDALTQIRTKYHAGDIILIEQAKLDHLQQEIAKTLQQLEAIKANAPE